MGPVLPLVNARFFAYNSPVPAVLAKPVAEKKPKKNLKYGREWPDTANPLNIEMACYHQQETQDDGSLKRTPEAFQTGHPREYHLRKAFEIVWPKFQWNEWCELMIWAWCNYRIVCVIGHSRASKSFFFSHLALLDYLASPMNTATTLTTTKFDALKTRMWGDMMRAIESIEHPVIKAGVQTLFRVTNSSNELKFQQSAKDVHGDDKFMIQGVATDSADKSAGKIRGQHADRRRIIGDEAQDIASAIYMAFANAISAPDFVGVLLSNPVEKLSDFGNWCRPKAGWGSINDTDIHWETDTPGGICLHFDGLQSPNIKSGKDIFPFMLTQSYVDFVRTRFGEGSLEWWCFIRGFFPPDGVVARVWPDSTQEKARKGCEFDFPPTPVASLDPAYEYDDPVLTLGLLGRSREGKPCCMVTKQTRIQFKLDPKVVTKDRQLANETMRLCREYGVTAENFICDTTGNGRSVYALMFESWGPKIQKLEYGGSATDRPLRLDDGKPSNEQVKYFVAELWFRASYLAADGMLCGLGNLDPKCAEDLSSRRYTLRQDGDRGKVMVVETKEEMKKRLGRSPDYGDSLCQIGELMVRKGLLGEVMGARGGGKSQWEQLKALARKAAARYKEDKWHA